MKIALEQTNFQNCAKEIHFLFCFSLFLWLPTALLSSRLFHIVPNVCKFIIQNVSVDYFFSIVCVYCFISVFIFIEFS